MKRLVLVLLGSLILSSWMVWSQNLQTIVPEMGPDHPNILWVVLEDTNPWMSCYGDQLINTPNIDEVATQGALFERAYMTAGVCSPTRSALITGMYQTAIGAHQHYSSYRVWRGIEMDVWDPIHIGVKTLPEIFRAAGYYTFNEGKTHYNFVFSGETLYDRINPVNAFLGARDGSEWSGRREGQPFFGQIQLLGDKFTNPPEIVSPEDVMVPPYYPNHHIFRESIAHHYNSIIKMDEILGEIIARLKEDGLYEHTVIFFFSDHGMHLPRHKQFLYEGGIKVPLVIAGPGIPKNQVRKDLVSGIDISATSLELAGIPTPGNMHGRNMFAEDYQRDFVVAARDRCDYTIDRIRAVVTDRYKYIRNFMTDRPYLQPQYRDGEDYMEIWKVLYRDGKLNELQARFAGPDRPAEELYDLWLDPHETTNLVHSYQYDHAMELARHRDILSRWILETDDKGRFPESDEGLKAVIRRWGDDAVNQEYKRVRE